MKVDWVPFGDLMQLERRVVEVDPEQTYTEIGVRSFGRGLFIKPAVDGVDLGNKRVFRVQSGDLVVSNVFAWEGAVGVAEGQHAGLIGSHRFMTWVPRRPQLVSAEYLALYFGSEEGLESLRRASPGSAGRNRTLSIQSLRQIKTPVPQRSVQNRIVGHLGDLSVSSRADQGLANLNFIEISGERAKVGDLISEVSRSEPVLAEEQYPMQGVRWYGEGMFTREVRPGIEVRTSKVNRVEPGDLIYNRLFAWKQSFAIAENHGYVSNEFPTFGIKGARVRPRVLLELLLSRAFTSQVNAASTGTTPTSRNRLKVADFLQLEVDLPPMEVQVRYEQFLKTRDQAKSLARRVDELSAALLPAARNEIFSSMR